MATKHIHSSGNWSYILEEHKFIIINDEKEQIAETLSISGDDGGYIEDANARLIASSPKLLENLENMLFNFSGKQGLSPMQKKAIEYAREAVGNATGETYAQGGTVSRFKSWLNERIW